MTRPIPLTEWQEANTPESWPLHIRRNTREGAGGCWLWTRSTSRDGYGWASLNNKTHQAHRLAYILTHGEPGPGLVLDHTCRVRRCVNPAHLEPVTNAENLSRSPLTPSGMTHCKRGHEFSQWHGQRRCLICKAEADREWRAGVKR